MQVIHELVEHRRTITLTLATIAVLLVMAHVGWQLFTFFTGHDYVFGLIKLFHLDEEWNIPALFSAILLISAAMLLSFIAVREKQSASQDWPKWMVLAIGFVYMAIDEFGHLHEQLILPGRALLGDRSLGLLYYAWVVPAMLIVLALGIFFLGFLRRLPPWTMRAFLLAGAMFVGGAVGVEMLEGRHDLLYGERNATYQMYVTIEEAMEMLGVVVFIGALLRYIAEKHPAHLAQPEGTVPQVVIDPNRTRHAVDRS